MRGRARASGTHRRRGRVRREKTLAGGERRRATEAQAVARRAGREDDVHRLRIEPERLLELRALADDLHELSRLHEDELDRAAPALEAVALDRLRLADRLPVRGEQRVDRVERVARGGEDVEVAALLSRVGERDA